MQGFHGEMEQQLESYTSVDISSAGQGDTDAQVLDLKLKALILDTIHNIDVIDQLSDARVGGMDEWLWQKQLRSMSLLILMSPITPTAPD